jgi:hypothetical protein
MPSLFPRGFPPGGHAGCTLGNDGCGYCLRMPDSGGRPLWVARVLISPRTAQKVAQRHGIDVDALRDAIVCVEGLPYVWDEDPGRGPRAIISVSIMAKPCYVVLYPTNDPDIYRLGSTNRRDGGRMNR